MWQIRNQNELLIRNRFDVRRGVRFKSLRKAALDGVLTPWWLCVDWYSPRVPTATQMLPFGEEVEGMSDGNWIWPSARRDRHSLCKITTAGSPAYANSGNCYDLLEQTWMFLIGWKLWSIFSNCFMFNFLCPADHRPEEANGELGIPVKNPPEPPPPRSVSDDHHNLSWR